SAQEEHPGRGDPRDMSGVRRAHEASPRPSRLFPRLLQVSQVQRHPRSTAGSARAGPGYRRSELMKNVRNKSWKRTIGIFTDDPGMKQLFAEALRIREKDRQRARRLEKKRKSNS